VQGYDRWVSGDLAFGSPQVGAAIDALGRYVARPGAVYNGLAGAARTPERIAALPMFLPTPGCWLYRGSSTNRSGFPADVAARAGAVVFPRGASGAQPVLGRLYMVVILHDRPEVRQLAESLVGASFASALAPGLCDAGMFPVRKVAGSTGCADAAEADRLRAGLASGAFRVRAVDLFPPKVASAFLTDVSWYLHVASMEGSAVSPGDWGGWTADEAWLEVRAEGWP
jgi:hypothetical protein